MQYDSCVSTSSRRCGASHSHHQILIYISLQYSTPPPPILNGAPLFQMDLFCYRWARSCPAFTPPNCPSLPPPRLESPLPAPLMPILAPAPAPVMFCTMLATLTCVPSFTSYPHWPMPLVATLNTSFTVPADATFVTSRPRPWAVNLALKNSGGEPMSHDVRR